MRRLAAALLVIGFATAADADTLKLAHDYAVAGTNPNGSPYKGRLALEVISDTTYTVKWSIGGSTIRGFGMRMNDMLSATYMLNGQPGLVMYQVRDDGGLDGIWAIKGHDGFGTERLTPAD
jgi:hypothetical protein